VPPELALRTTRVRGGTATTLKFSLSKISRTSVSITAPDGKRVLSVSAGTVGRGTRTVSWTAPRKPGAYTVRIDATDLAGNAASIEEPVDVLRAKRRKK
jgi:hypothetical protein